MVDERPQIESEDLAIIYDDLPVDDRQIDPTWLTEDECGDRVMEGASERRLV